MDLMRISETAEILRCSSSTVRKLIDEGRLPVVRLTTTARGFRVRREDIDKFLEEEACQSKNEAVIGGYASGAAEKRFDEVFEKKLASINHPRKTRSDTTIN